MRKCYLCGSLIRRRAEFCRYCTVRQPGFPSTDSPEASAEGAPPGHLGASPPLLQPPTPIDTAPLELAMQPVARSQVAREPEPVQLDVAPAPRHTAAAPVAYEIDPPPGAAEVELPDALRPSTEAADAADEAVAVEPTIPVEPAASVEPDEPVEPVELDPPAPPNGARSRSRRRNGHRHAVGRNGHAVDGAPPAIGNGNGNGNGAEHRAGTGSRPSEVVEPVAVAARANGSAPKRGRPTDALRGFEHFPEATAAPKVRWG